MITAKVDTTDFVKKMNQFIDYSFGFFEGAESGKKELLNNLGDKLIVVIGEYIDSSARVNPSSLHHVYEWDEVGSESARLFDFDKIITNSSLRLRYSFSQSQSVRIGSTEPFLNKAEIMEAGIPVVIKPRQKAVLRFEVDGQEVFTSKPVTVMNPGGEQTVNGFKMTVDEFFKTFSQSILTSTGIAKRLKDLSIFVGRMGSGGRMVGKSAGYRWITSAGGIL